MLFTTGGGSLGGTLALTLDTSQNATFAKAVTTTDSLIVANRSVTSSTTNYENVLRVKGKNNYSDGTTWYGTYGQILLHADTNMTGSAKRYLITNALNNRDFAIVRSTDGNTDPVVNSTSTGVNSGTADFIISHDTGNATFAGDVILGTNAYAKKIYRNTPTISSSSYTTVATVNGSSLGSAIRMTVMGTSGNVVLANIAEIIVNHSTDILIKTTNSFYSRLFIKITSNNNEDFAIELKRSGDTNDTGIQLEIEPLNDEEVTFTNSHSFSGATLEHESLYGEVTSHTDTAGNSYHKSMRNNQKLKFGNSGQFDLYHNGSNGFIENDTGDLTIDNQGDDLILKAADDALLYVQGSDIAIQAIGNGKVGLRYNNVEKLETTSDGVSITGNTIIDGTPFHTGATVFDVQGDDGQLFSVTNSLSGDLFSVSDVSGVPILNINSSGAITLDGYIPYGNKLNFGSIGSGLEIYSDSGSNSYIAETVNAGSLVIN